WIVLTRGLTVRGRSAQGACSVFNPELAVPGRDPSYPRWAKWIALNPDLFRGRDAGRVRGSGPAAFVIEEIAHALDWELEHRKSPYCSNPDIEESLWTPLAWLRDQPGPLFPVPGRKSPERYDPLDEMNAEDWALAVVWYICRRHELLDRSRAHHDFVE